MMRTFSQTVVVAVFAVAACGKKGAPPVAAARDAASAPAPVPAAPLVAGAVAPDFEVVAHDGKTYRLAAFAGHPVVLYFFPKADTPG